VCILGLDARWLHGGLVDGRKRGGDGCVAGHWTIYPCRHVGKGGSWGERSCERDNCKRGVFPPLSLILTMVMPWKKRADCSLPHYHPLSIIMIISPLSFLWRPLFSLPPAPAESRVPSLLLRFLPSFDSPIRRTRGAPLRTARRPPVLPGIGAQGSASSALPWPPIPSPRRSCWLLLVGF
jgi:hypothetical protein